MLTKLAYDTTEEEISLKCKTPKQYFILVHSLFLEKLIQLSNPQLELDFHYASRIFKSNHNQSTIPTLEYKPKRTQLLAQTRKPYSSML